MDEELETYMANFVQRQAPESVGEFIEAIQENGVSQEEVDEVRQITMETLSNPENYPRFVQYLISAELIEEGSAPPEFKIGFVLSILGLVGIAQKLVTPS